MARVALESFQKPSPLLFNPFEDKDDDDQIKHLSDCIVKAKIHHVCYHCNQTIKPSTRYRKCVSLENFGEGRKIREHKFCWDCVKAMVRDLELAEEPVGIYSSMTNFFYNRHDKFATLDRAPAGMDYMT